MPICSIVSEEKKKKKSPSSYVQPLLFSLSETIPVSWEEAAPPLRLSTEERLPWLVISEGPGVAQRARALQFSLLRKCQPRCWVDMSIYPIPLRTKSALSLLILGIFLLSVSCQVGSCGGMALFFFFVLLVFALPSLGLSIRTRVSVFVFFFFFFLQDAGECSPGED